MKIEVVQGGVATQGRKNRSPRHHFSIHQKPWQIVPFCITPVWPGETMKNLLVQARVVSDPLRNRMVGWWYEQYWFYVKHRDLADRDLVTGMHLDPTVDLAPLESAADVKYYHSGGINWTKLCLRRVVEEYFRNEDEAWDTAMIDGYPAASINIDNWLDSAKLESQVAENSERVPGEGEPVIPDGVPAGFENHFTQWQHMRALQLTTATFEDYLRTYGVKVARENKVEEIHRPELLRYVKDWTYPAFAIEPTTGLSSNAATWNLAERADKDRYFTEPGFIIGVSVCRPKVYMGNLKGSAVSLMNDAYAWLPAVLSAEPYTSLRKIDGGDATSPLDVGEDAWVDIKDLAIYGDQFVNHPIAAPYTQVAAVPVRATLQRRYAAEGDIPGLFAEVGSILIKSDGIASFTIASRLTDTSLHGRQGGYSVGGGEPGGPGGAIGGGGGGGPIG